MGIKWDPKISQVIKGSDLEKARQAPSKPPGKGISDIETPQSPNPAGKSPGQSQFAPRGGLKSPSHVTTQPISLQEKELAKLSAALRGDVAMRQAAAEQAMQLVATYEMRRSKQMRKQSLSLLDEILELTDISHESITALRDILLAEAQLHELKKDLTWNSASRLLDHAQTAGPHQELAQATLARTLTQLALHFPSSLDEADLSIESCLEQAFFLSEAAAAAAPDLADPPAALGRLLLIHGGPEALGDAETLFRLSLSHDPEFDPARLGLANCLSLGNQTEEALAEVELLIQKGMTFPGLWALRAQLKASAGDLKTALRDIERANKLAPESGLYHLQAAQIAARAGHSGEAEVHAQKAEQLLGEYYIIAKQHF